MNQKYSNTIFKFGNDNENGFKLNSTELEMFILRRVGCQEQNVLFSRTIFFQINIFVSLKLFIAFLEKESENKMGKTKCVE